GKLFSVPIEASGRAGAVTEVTLDRPLQRPDGMRSFGKKDALIVETAPPGRLSRIVLNGNSGKLVSLKEGYPDGPVSVTTVATTADVLEGQLAILFGRAPPNTVEKPYHATAVEVGVP